MKIKLAELNVEIYHIGDIKNTLNLKENL